MRHGKGGWAAVLLLGSSLGCSDYKLSADEPDEAGSPASDDGSAEPPDGDVPPETDPGDSGEETTGGVDPNTAPTIAITAPDPGGTFYVDLMVSLEVEVADVESAPETLRVTWSSDRGDVLPADLVPDPTGAVATSSLLTDGTHVLTATVIDPDGASGSASVTIGLAGSYNIGSECGAVPAYTLPTCAEATGVYFSDIRSTNPSIFRMDPDGTNLTTSYTEVADDLEVDLVGGLLYWVRADSIIERGPLGGGPIETVQPALPYAYGIALHPFARRIYWTNQVGTPKVEQSCFWGGDTTAVLPSLGPGGNCCAIGIDIDFDQEKIYWMDGYYGGPISRMNLDGTGIEILGYTAGIGNGVAIDHRNGKLYWTEYGSTSVIRRANLDGSDAETLLTTMDGLATPQHIAVDPEAGKLYWADMDATAQIARSDLDGSNIEMLYTGGQEIRAIALERQSPCR